MTIHGNIALYPLTVRIAYAEKFGWVLDEPDDVDKTEQPKPLPTLGRVVGGERAGVMVLVTEDGSNDLKDHA